jgi:hypothetical protein
MELASLYPATDPIRKFQRNELIEDFSSLVWTERFDKNGDFQLVSNNIADILEKLPLPGPFDPPCMVAIRDSKTPMIVESHLIEEPKNGPPKITTTGRSFETFLEERQTLKVIDSTVARVPRIVAANKPADAVLIVMSETIGPEGLVPEDRIPEISLIRDVTEAVPVANPQPQYAVDAKDLYSWAMETLKLGTPDTNFPEFGNIRGPAGLRSSLPLFGGTQIEIKIYEGVDRRSSVVFDAKQDQFDELKHLLSVVGYKNVMVTAAANGLKNAQTRSESISGLSRRVGFQDISSEVSAPSSDVRWAPFLINKSKVALASATPTVLFSGEIANQQAARFGIDYYLGDQVKLSGDYGLTQDVRIAEFVRSQDSTGTKSYPTFEAITPWATQ